MKHTDALIALITRINNDLKLNEKQLLGARDEVTRLQQRQSDLRQQLGRARYAGHLKGDSCPDCYVTFGKDQLLENSKSDTATLACPVCNWTHVEPRPQRVESDKWILQLESASGAGFQTVEI